MSSIRQPVLPDEDELYERHRQKLLDEELIGGAGNEDSDPQPSALIGVLCGLALIAWIGFGLWKAIL